MAKSFKRLAEPIYADPTRRARVAAFRRGIRDALALAELREQRRTTQQEVAATLGVSQANVSRIEHQEDLYLSTLAGYVEALGGRLEIRAVFPEEVIWLTPAGRPDRSDSVVIPAPPGRSTGAHKGVRRPTVTRRAVSSFLRFDSRSRRTAYAR